MSEQKDNDTPDSAIITWNGKVNKSENCTVVIRNGVVYFCGWIALHKAYTEKDDYVQIGQLSPVAYPMVDIFKVGQKAIPAVIHQFEMKSHP